MRLNRPYVLVASCSSVIALAACVPKQSEPAGTPAHVVTSAELPPESTVDQVEKQAPPTPPDKGAYATGEYRNLFTERGFPEAEVDKKISDAHQQLFHGDPKEQAVFFEAGSNENGPTAYIMDIANDDIRSEGMSYGMMIAVQMDQKADFDALWNWAKTHMYHADPKHPVHGFFSWQMKPDGTAVDEMPAPDGEEYFAMALIFAAHRWGVRPGIYDYAAEAEQLLLNMKNRKDITGKVNRTRATTAGALFNVKEKQVRFTPDHDNFEKNGDHTNPSYHLPAFYELWALWGPEKDRSFWAEAAQTGRDYFVKCTHPKTGLAPDYANFDGSPKAASWDKDTATFRYDAWRTAMNWAVDYVWWAKDPRQRELSDRLQLFFDSQGAKTHGNNFTLDGKRTSPHHSAGLVATNAVASLAATQSRAWKFVDDLWQVAVPSGKWRYYDGMLYLFGMLHVSGKFRIYQPAD